MPWCLDALPACILNAPEMLQIDALCGGRQRLFMRRGRTDADPRLLLVLLQEIFVLY